MSRAVVDSALRRAKADIHNITVGVSFGACRELAIVQARTDSPCRVYIPQPNNSCFTLGRDVNIRCQYGINALTEDQQELAARGAVTDRLCIMVWGAAANVVEEAQSPPMPGNKNNNNKRKNNNKNKRKNAKPPKETPAAATSEATAQETKDETKETEVTVDVPDAVQETLQSPNIESVPLDDGASRDENVLEV